MLVEVIKSFNYAHDGGVRVRRYVPGVQNLDDEVAATALKEGWARKKMQPEAPDNKMDAVPSNKEARSTLSLHQRKSP
jgi:hypothetical protein